MDRLNLNPRRSPHAFRACPRTCALAWALLLATSCGGKGFSVGPEDQGAEDTRDGGAGDASQPIARLLDEGARCDELFVEPVPFSDEFSRERLDSAWQTFGPDPSLQGGQVLFERVQSPQSLRTEEAWPVRAVCVELETPALADAFLNASVNLRLESDVSIAVVLRPGQRRIELFRTRGEEAEMFAQRSVDWDSELTVLLRDEGERWVVEVRAGDEVFAASGPADAPGPFQLRVGVFGLPEGASVRLDNVRMGMLRGM